MFSHGLGQLDYSALDLFSSQEEQLPLSFRAMAHSNETRWPEGHPQLKENPFPFIKLSITAKTRDI